MCEFRPETFTSRTMPLFFQEKVTVAFVYCRIFVSVLSLEQKQEKKGSLSICGLVHCQHRVKKSHPKIRTMVVLTGAWAINRFGSTLAGPASVYTQSKGHSYRRAFFPIFRHLNFVSRNFSILHIFLGFFPNIGMLTNLIFLVLENFTNSDRTPPYIDTYLHLFPNFGNFGKKRSSIRVSLRPNEAQPKNEKNTLYLPPGMPPTAVLMVRVRNIDKFYVLRVFNTSWFAVSFFACFCFLSSTNRGFPTAVSRPSPSPFLFLILFIIFAHTSSSLSPSNS